MPVKSICSSSIRSLQTSSKAEASLVHRAAQLHWNTFRHVRIPHKRTHTHTDRAATAFCSPPAIPVSLQSRAQSRPWERSAEGAECADELEKN